MRPRWWLVAFAVGGLGCDGMLQAVRSAQEERLASMRACEAHVAAECKRLADAEMVDYRGGADPGHDWTLASASRHYDQACTGGIVDACLSLVRIVTDVPARALPPARRACDLGSASGCLLAIENLSLLRVTGAREHAEMVDHAKRACDVDVDACPEAARAIASFDPVSAEGLAMRPCDGRHAKACERSANLGFSGEIQQRLETGACESGVLTVCERRAFHLLATDRGAARELYRRTCARGSDRACGYLGEIIVGIEIE